MAFPPSFAKALQNGGRGATQPRPGNHTEHMTATLFKAVARGEDLVSAT